MAWEFVNKTLGAHGHENLHFDPISWGGGGGGGG